MILLPTKRESGTPLGHDTRPPRRETVASGRGQAFWLFFGFWLSNEGETEAGAPRLICLTRHQRETFASRARAVCAICATPWHKRHKTREGRRDGPPVSEI